MSRLSALLVLFLVAGCAAPAAPGQTPPAAFPLPASPVALVSDARVPGLLWAATARNPREHVDPGACGPADHLSVLYRSVDNGDHWQRVAFGAPRIVVDPGEPGVLLLSCRESMWRIPRDGGTPQLIHEAPGRTPGLGSATSIPLAPNSATGEIFIAPAGSLLRSSDRGRSWRSDGEPIPSGDAIAMLAIAPGAPERVLAVAGRTLWERRGGAAWTARSQLPEAPRSLELSPQRPDLVLAATEHAIYRSADDGSTWILTYALPQARSRWAVGQSADEDGIVPSVAFDPSRPGHVLVAAGPGGLLESSDGGGTWTRRHADESYGVASGSGPRLFVAQGTRGIYRERPDPWPWTPEWESANVGLPYQTNSALDDLVTLLSWLLGLGFGVVLTPFAIWAMRGRIGGPVRERRSTA
jgi:photosystem II stability/assembly factor-like uncharacterized protein